MDLGNKRVMVQVRTGMGAYVFNSSLPGGLQSEEEQQQTLLKNLAHDAKEFGGILIQNACKFQIQQDASGRVAQIGIAYIGEVEQSEMMFIPYEVLMGFAILRNSKVMDPEKLDKVIEETKAFLKRTELSVEIADPGLAAQIERERHGGNQGNRR